MQWVPGLDEKWLFGAERYNSVDQSLPPSDVKIPISVTSSEACSSESRQETCPNCRLCSLDKIGSFLPVFFL